MFENAENIFKNMIIQIHPIYPTSPLGQDMSQVQFF